MQIRGKQEDVSAEQERCTQKTHHVASPGAPTSTCFYFILFWEEIHIILGHSALKESDGFFRKEEKKNSLLCRNKLPESDVSTAVVT